MPEINKAVGTIQSPLEKVIDESTNGFKHNFKFVYVTLSFDDYGTMAFVFLRQQSDSIKEAKQQFYGLTQDQQKEKSTEFRINILADLLTERPHNVPDYPQDDINFKAEFINYFSQPDNEELLSWVWSEYQDKLYPKEITSRLTE